MNNEKLLNKMIENLFYDFLQSENCTEDLQETKRAANALNDFYFSNERFKDVKADLERLINNVSLAKETQGFINGFKWAVKML